MEQTMTQETKIVIKKTIPNKQKTTIKLIMWALNQVLDKEATTAKVVELFKLGESIETIIEMVDEIENSAEYAQMETNLTDIRTSFKPTPASRKKNVAAEKVSGDPDTIIKQLVEMAINESKPTTVKKPRAPKKAKEYVASEAETDAVVGEAVIAVKKPRAPKKVVVKEVAPEVIGEYVPEIIGESVPEVISETAGKKPRAPKKVAVKEVAPEVIPTEVISETAGKKSRAPKKAVVKEVAPEVITTEVINETAVKKPRAPKKVAVKEVATEVISESVIISEATVKKPRASKKAAVVEAPPVAVSDDLCEEEYLILNEVECDGTTYLVDSEQNIVDEFNAVIGKYENGKATLV